MLFYVRLSCLLGPLGGVLDASWGHLGDFLGAFWGLLGPLGATEGPLGTHKSVLTLPQPPQSSQEAAQEAPRASPEPPQSLPRASPDPNASQIRPIALPKPFRRQYRAANWPRRDARSV